MADHCWPIKTNTQQFAHMNMRRILCASAKTRFKVWITHFLAPHPVYCKRLTNQIGVCVIIPEFLTSTQIIVFHMRRVHSVLNLGSWIVCRAWKSEGNRFVIKGSHTVGYLQGVRKGLCSGMISFRLLTQRLPSRDHVYTSVLYVQHAYCTPCHRSRFANIRDLWISRSALRSAVVEHSVHPQLQALLILSWRNVHKLKYELDEQLNTTNPRCAFE